MSETLQLEPRKYRRQSTAFLTREQIRALWRLHVITGKPVSEIVAHGWRQWGYRSEQIARNRVYAALRLDGLPLRRTCAACGCDRDTRTLGCDVCASRHWNRTGKHRPKVMVRA